jgi:5'-nucleotidase
VTRHEIYLRGNTIAACAIDGSPAQVVACAVLGVAPRRPDLCVCGVNAGENVGLSLTASGTVGAAFQAHALGVPSLAVSQQVPHMSDPGAAGFSADWTAAVRLTGWFAAKIIEFGLPSEVATLNVNVPSAATEATEVRWTRQDQRTYYGLSCGRKPGNEAFALNEHIQLDGSRNDPLSDIVCLQEGAVSVTPLRWSLTSDISPWLMNQ